jgi:tetratricopeptide (TPR) repeat protein
MRHTLPPPAELAKMRADTERAVALFAAQGDAEGESAALDAIAAICRAVGDSATALEFGRRRVAASAGLSLLERVDAWAGTVWDLVFIGRYEEAVRMDGEAHNALRAGEPHYMLSHATAWAAYAAAVCGQWKDALAISDKLLGLREDSSHLVARFTYPGWIGALRVASAMQDTTRLARYTSIFATIASPEQLPEPTRSAWTAFLDRDAAAARRYILASGGGRDRKGELIAFMVFELDERLSEDELAAVERQALRDPPVLALRVQLARAINGDAAALRRAIAALDEGHLVPDAARAATLLALRTKDRGDHADAKRRLEALGDRAYLQKLAEG